MEAEVIWKYGNAPVPAPPESNPSHKWLNTALAATVRIFIISAGTYADYEDSPQIYGHH